jgi:hypothetical protein
MTQNDSKLRRVLLSAGDVLALAAICALYVDGFLTRGIVAGGVPRLLAWTLCGLLGVWAMVGWAMGRWQREKLNTHKWVIGLMAATALVTGLQMIPLPMKFVAGVSPLWEETLAAMVQMGQELPERIPFALAPEKALWSWNQLVASMLFFAGVAMLVARRSNVRFLIHLVAAAAVLEGLLGVVNYGLGETERVSAAIFNPNHHSTMVLMGMPLAVAVLFRYRRRRFMEGSAGGPALFLAGLTVVAMIGALLSLSRSGLLSGGIVLVFWLAVEFYGAWRLRPREESWRPSGQQKLAGLLVVVAMIVLSMSAALVEGYARRFGSEEQEVTRGDLARATWAGFQESHYLGFGFGGTEFLINRHADWATITNAIWAHNDLLQIVVELGVPGLLVCAPFLIGALLSFRKKVTGMVNAGHWERNLLSRAAFAGVLITLIHAFADFHLRIPLIGLQFLILLAIAFAPVTAWDDDEDQ